MMDNAGNMGRMGTMMSGQAPWIMGVLALLIVIIGVVVLRFGLRAGK
jgi:hypothetical protein